MNLTSSLKTTLTVTEAVAYGSASQNVDSKLAANLAYTNGTGTDQANLQWGKTGVTLAGGASVTYTLSSLTDDLGRAVAFTGVRLLVISVTSRTAGDYLTVGNAASNPWAAPFGGGTHTTKVYTFLAVAADKTDKFVVSSGSSDQLKLVNSGSNSLTFSIHIVGV